MIGSSLFLNWPIAKAILYIYQRVNMHDRSFSYVVVVKGPLLIFNVNFSKSYRINHNKLLRLYFPMT